MQSVTDFQNARGPLSALIVGLAVIAMAAPAAADVILQADFTYHTIGEVIGVGGAAAGEPVDLGGTDAIVALAPTISNALKLTDRWTDQAAYVQFEFINNVEVTTGQVTLQATLSFSNHNNCSFSVREQGGRASNFADLIFKSDGAVHWSDAGTPETAVDTYVTNTAYDVVFVFDLDAGTYSLTVNGEPRLTDQPIGVTSGRGIGGFYVGIDNDPDTTGMLFIDDILVTTTAQVAADPLTWTAVKGIYR
ncbi:MAG: hypothetical protein R6X25_00560 [Candidatus Krumholzibacteriia bacterium]